MAQTRQINLRFPPSSSSPFSAGVSNRQKNRGEVVQLVFPPAQKPTQPRDTFLFCTAHTVSLEHRTGNYFALIVPNWPGIRERESFLPIKSSSH